MVGAVVEATEVMEEDDPRVGVVVAEVTEAVAGVVAVTGEEEEDTADGANKMKSRLYCQK